MNGMLAAGLDLRSHLVTMSEVGVGVVKAALTETALPSLLQELDTLPFFDAPENTLPVTTKCEMAVLEEWAGAFPIIDSLGAELVERVHNDGAKIAGLPDWRPNRVFVRRYHPGSIGLLPHTDGVRFAYLVATFTVLGSATFRVYGEAERVVDQWQTAPGDLVLLRGPGLSGVADGRPSHAVGGPGSQVRCSVAFRMDSQPAPL